MSTRAPLTSLADRPGPSRMVRAVVAGLSLVLLSGPPAPLARPPASKPDSGPVAPAASRRGDPPPAARSVYLRTTASPTLRRLGCEQGRQVAARKRLDDAVVILAFGRPVRRHHVFGASLFGSRFRSTTAIGGAVEEYVRAYARCNPRLGRTHLTVAIGTSNYGSQVSFAHGRAWARMVNDVNERVRAAGTPAGSVLVAGANDIELAWNGPWISRRWVQGYDSAARWPYFNFGDAGACPPAGHCHGTWTMQDVWYVSWGARTAWPLPQIYTNSGTQAEQWYRLSMYSYRAHGQRMTITGALSQRQACRDSPDPCHGIKNTPRQAWRQLWRALNRDPRTAQDLRWSTDIRWQG